MRSSRRVSALWPHVQRAAYGVVGEAPGHGVALGFAVGRGGEQCVERGGGAAGHDGGQIGLEVGLFEERREQTGERLVEGARVREQRPAEGVRVPWATSPRQVASWRVWAARSPAIGWWVTARGRCQSAARRSSFHGVRVPASGSGGSENGSGGRGAPAPRGTVSRAARRACRRAGACRSCPRTRAVGVSPNGVWVGMSHSPDQAARSGTRRAPGGRASQSS